MQVKLSKYRHAKNDFEIYLNSRPGQEIHGAVGRYAVANHIPLVAIYHFAQEITGKDFTKEIEKLRVFYDYKEIVE